MDSCRWASYIGEPLSKIDENLIALPEDEQVIRGQTLMSFLKEQAPYVVTSPVPVEHVDIANLESVDWNVIVKQTFIEVVIPPCSAARRRTVSEPALCSSEKSENLRKSLSSDRIQDASDASTDDSIDGEDPAIVGWSSDDEGDAEYPVPQLLPFQCTEPWWPPQQCAPQAMPQQWSPQSALLQVPQTSGCPVMYPPTSTGYNSVQLSFDAPTSPASLPAGWLEASLAQSGRISKLNADAPSYVPAGVETANCHRSLVGVHRMDAAPQEWQTQGGGSHGASAVDCHGVHSMDAAPHEWRTTVMIRNMPNNYTLDMMLELVDLMGFIGTYNFAYLPVDFHSQAGLGYAFLNFATVADAQRCFRTLEGFSNWKVPSDKVCTVTWSSPTQGLEEHIDRYRNSPVMHPALPDGWRPAYFQQGIRVPFPPPTKAIKAPKVRQHPKV